MIFGTDIGAELVRHPAIQAVGFTGSLAGGKALYQMAQQRRDWLRTLLRHLIQRLTAGQ
jgi:acyl-CoA reductase-like NAD-dependent aldehyde dehydrogenase